MEDCSNLKHNAAGSHKPKPNNTPLISIILPTYNGETYIVESLESILSQTYHNWELIIVDDCSTDTTPTIISEYAEKDSRIKIFRNEENKKLPTSLNIGFAQASGTYYTWTSDDNYYEANALETMINFLESNPQYGMVCAQVNYIGHPKRKLGCTQKISPSMLLRHNLCESCFLYRKSIADIVGEYDKEMALIEDYDYWLRIMLQAPIAHIETVLYNYRFHDKSLTSKFRKHVLKKHIELIVKHSDAYKAKFSELSSYVDGEIKLYQSILENDENLYRATVKNMPKKSVYKSLSFILPAFPDRNIIKKVWQLGGIYSLKSLNLWRKNLKLS